MKKPDIAKSIAKESRLSDAEAADRLDRIVHQILSNLRKGKEAALPGLGKFTSPVRGSVKFEREGAKRHD